MRPWTKNKTAVGTAANTKPIIGRAITASISGIVFHAI